MATRERKSGGEVPAFENCDTFFGVFFWWLLDQPLEARAQILKEGIPIRLLVEEIAPRKTVLSRLRGRGGNPPSPGAYPYAVTASLRARDYFRMLDAGAMEAVANSGSDTFVYRRPEVIDTTVVPNPDSKDARLRGFPYAILGAKPSAASQPGGEKAPAKRTRRTAVKRGKKEEATDSSEPPEPVERPADLEEGESRGGDVEWSVPPAFQSAAPGWQRRSPTPARSPVPPRPLEETDPDAGEEGGWGWRDRGGRPAPGREASVSARTRDFAGRTDLRERQAPPRREDAPSPRRAALLMPVPPLPKRSVEDLVADYLASPVGPPIVDVERGEDGRVRYRGWAADLGSEFLPGRRSLDLRQERDFTTLLFLVAALSLDGGYASSVKHLRALCESNLVSFSFWRDEGTLLKVGAPRRLPVPQPLQIAFHVLARNEPILRDALGFEEIMAGRRPSIDVEKVYRTLMAERMELPRYWTGPFKRNRRHRRLLPSRLGRVLVARIPTLLRELHCQGVIEVDPAECCAADRIVRRAMYAAGIPVKKPINRMAPLRENSRAIYEKFGDLFEMPLHLYGRTWRRR